MKSAEEFLAELDIKHGADLGKTPESKTSTEPGLMSGSDDIETLKKQIEQRAVALLAGREHGAKELRQKLRQKFPETPELLDKYHEVTGFVSTLVDDVLDICQENNWQSDERYLEQAVRSYLDKGQGPMKIKQKLQAASCADSDLIDAYLDLSESDWVIEARKALQKKYGDTSKPREQKEQAKRMRFLQSRGFFPGTIWKAFT